MTNTGIVKMSLLVQYLRIFKAGTMRRICLGLLVLVTLWGLTFGILAWVPCYPVRSYWDRVAYPNPKCFGFGIGTLNDIPTFIRLFEAHTALNMMLDFIIFVTPMVLFREPNLRMKSIFAMAGIFVLGAV
jgi:hypothetical protein